MVNQDSALVLLSGGMDSAVCFFWAMYSFEKVVAVSFDYGQRHFNEIEYARHIVATGSNMKKRRYEHCVCELNMPTGKHIKSALTCPSTKLKSKGGYNNLPTSFVPGRNLIFLSHACTEAMVRGIPNVVIGANIEDYSGYPDCRPEFIHSFTSTFIRATNFDMKVHTPLMRKTKAEIFGMFDFNPKLFSAIRFNTISCYEGCTDTHEWGFGCAKCPSCKIRAKGWKEYKRDKKRN